MTDVVIDGSEGEGGGQVLRTAVALAARTGRPLLVTNIRSRRENPGLRPQHVAAVEAVAAACGGVLEGAEVGSTTLRFEPGPIAAGTVKVDTGTAGSTTLIVETMALLAPALPGPLTVDARGGTDTQWAPTLRHFIDAFVPAARRAGVGMEVLDAVTGFYPAGGGRVRARIHPRVTPQAPGRWDARGELEAVDVRVKLSKLEPDIGQRVGKAAARILQHAGYKVRTTVEELVAPSPGVVVDAVATFERAALGANALGAPGVRSEIVGRRCGEALLSELTSGASVDVHIADQLVPLVYDVQGAGFVVREVTGHLRTNLEVAARFLRGRADIDDVTGGHRVSFEG